MTSYNRRDFIRTAAAAGAGMMLLGSAGCKSGFSRSGKKSTAAQLRTPGNLLENNVFVAKGEDPAAMVRAALEEAGGISRFVKKGDVVVLKPNIAFDRTPELAATTNPDLVAELVRLCLKAGAGKVKVFDNPCNDVRRTYRNSGIAKAAEAAGAQVKILEESDFVDTEIPDAKVLTKWWLSKDILEADVFINMPIAKHHGATGLTLGLKNMMGTAGGQRGAWHVAHLDQRIADVNTAVHPDLVILDAYRILTDHGPTGGSPGDVKMAQTVALATDIVAVDAFGTTLFGKKPSDIKHIGFAHEMGLGEMDLEKINVREVTA